MGASAAYDEGMTRTCGMPASLLRSTTVLTCVKLW